MKTEKELIKEIKNIFQLRKIFTDLWFYDFERLIKSKSKNNKIKIWDKIYNINYWITENLYIRWITIFWNWQSIDFTNEGEI